MAERRAGLGRGLGELFQRTDLDTLPHPVDQHVIVDQLGRNGHVPSQRAGKDDSSKDGPSTKVDDARVSRETPHETPGTAIPEAVASGRSDPAADVARPVASPSVVTETPDGEQDRPTVDRTNGYFAEIPIDLIHANAKQPRAVFEDEALAELVGSIQEVGLLQPIVVRKDAVDSYELVMGERRWRASRLAGLGAVPAIVRATADDDMLRDALLENIHRVQLNPLEEAAAYQQLMEDFGCTQQQLAGQIKRSRSQIANTVRLLNLPPTVQRRVAAGLLSAGHARALLGLPDVPAQERLAQRIVAEGLSVRATEEIVALGTRDRPRPPQRTPRGSDPRLQELSTELGNYFDTRVEVSQGPKKGKIVVEFASQDDLHRIMGLLRR